MEAPRTAPGTSLQTHAGHVPWIPWWAVVLGAVLLAAGPAIVLWQILPEVAPAPCPDGLHCTTGELDMDARLASDARDHGAAFFLAIPGAAAAIGGLMQRAWRSAGWYTMGTTMIVGGALLAMVFYESWLFWGPDPRMVRHEAALFAALLSMVAVALGGGTTVWWGMRQRTLARGAPA